MTLQLEITNATQYATLYEDGRPIATLQRRRVYEHGPIWRAYDTEGREVRRFYIAAPAGYLAKETVRAIARQRFATPEPWARQNDGT